MKSLCALGALALVTNAAAWQLQAFVQGDCKRSGNYILYSGSLGNSCTNMGDQPANVNCAYYTSGGDGGPDPCADGNEVFTSFTVDDNGECTVYSGYNCDGTAVGAQADNGCVEGYVQSFLCQNIVTGS